ncbi:MAG: hypothetical protein Tsb0017_04250 [Geothermobacteraceae bacterium]
MNDDNSIDQSPTEQTQTADESGRQEERFPELAELQRDIERCLKSNRTFLEHFLDEEFEDELSDDDEQEPSIDDMEPEL